MLMAVPNDQNQTPDLGAAGRRSTRVSLAIPVVLNGKDTSGNTFRENTRTVVVNKQGAKIALMHQVALGSEVTIENHAVGVTTKAMVVWMGKRRNPNDPWEIGVQILSAENIWGIVFPPEDWESGPPIGVGGTKLDSALMPLMPPSPGRVKSSPGAAPVQARSEEHTSELQ